VVLKSKKGAKKVNAKRLKSNYFCFAKKEKKGANRLQRLKKQTLKKLIYKYLKVKKSNIKLKKINRKNVKTENHRTAEQVRPPNRKNRTLKI